MAGVACGHRQGSIGTYGRFLENRSGAIEGLARFDYEIVNGKSTLGVGAGKHNHKTDDKK